MNKEERESQKQPTEETQPVDVKNQEAVELSRSNFKGVDLKKMSPQMKKVYLKGLQSRYGYQAMIDTVREASSQSISPKEARDAEDKRVPVEGKALHRSEALKKGKSELSAPEAGKKVSLKGDLDSKAADKIDRKDMEKPSKEDAPTSTSDKLTLVFLRKKVSAKRVKEAMGPKALDGGNEKPVKKKEIIPRNKTRQKKVLKQVASAPEPALPVSAKRAYLPLTLAQLREELTLSYLQNGQNPRCRSWIEWRIRQLNVSEVTIDTPTVVTGSPPHSSPPPGGAAPQSPQPDGGAAFIAVLNEVKRGVTTVRSVANLTAIVQLFYNFGLRAPDIISLLQALGPNEIQFTIRLAQAGSANLPLFQLMNSVGRWLTIITGTVSCIHNLSHRQWGPAAADLYGMAMSLAIPWAGFINGIQAILSWADPALGNSRIWRLLRAIDPVGLGRVAIDTIATLIACIFENEPTDAQLNRLVERMRRSPASFFVNIGEGFGDWLWDFFND